jgi:hypothetical protein
MPRARRQTAVAARQGEQALTATTTTIAGDTPAATGVQLMHRKRLVSWDRPFVVEEGRVRDPVKRLVLIKDRDRSVSMIRTLPLTVDKTRTVTGATKPAAQGQCRLGQLALQAGVI